MSAMTAAATEVIQTSVEGAVGIVTLNRPKVRNAIDGETMERLVSALEALDRDSNIRVIIVTGGPQFFSAGADIKEMRHHTPAQFLQGPFGQRWERLRKVGKPIIAAVNGYAVGGGCELAMVCDMIVAAEDAFFAQPEIGIGVIPGAGGTQRLTRAIGKAKAMEMVMTGARLPAREAHARGLVTRVVPKELVLEEAKRLAAEIAAKSPVAIRAAKEAVLKAFDTSLETGLDFERRMFYLLFSTHDQQEGMDAFFEKRAPQFTGE